MLFSVLMNRRDRGCCVGTLGDRPPMWVRLILMKEAKQTTARDMKFLLEFPFNIRLDCTTFCSIKMESRSEKNWGGRLLDGFSVEKKLARTRF